MAKTTVGRSHAAHAITLAQASEAFRLRCQAQNLSAGTLIWYGENIKRWYRYLDTQGVTLAKQVTPTLIRSSLEDMRERGVSMNTVSRTYGGLRCFFGFLTRERMIPENPFQFVEKPRMEKKLIKPLSMEQAGRLLGAIKTKRWTAHNLRTIIVLLLDTGLRVSELIGVRRDAVDLPGGVLRVQAAQFFLGPRGRPLDRSGVRKLVVGYGRKADIQGVRVSPHTLRHTFAVLYIRNGGDSFSLQEILGHSTLEMTRRYVHLARRDVSEQHKKFSPMEALMPQKSDTISSRMPSAYGGA